MKAVILAGGLGSRLSEETTLRPKPMVEIGGRPIIWHIMKIFSHYEINDFIICLGYRGYMLKEYFANYALHMSDITIDICNKKITVHQNSAEPWRISLVDTGDGTMTGGRLKRISPYLEKDEHFCMTYGDGLADIDISALVAFHRSHGKMATVTAVHPPKRFGQIISEDTKVKTFKEKPDGEGGWINGGFFVLSPKVIDLIDGDATSWEREPLERLADKEQIHAFEHEGFWQPMDTLRDKNYIEELWQSGKAPWRLWS